MEIKINPKINFYEAEYYLKNSLNPHPIKNTEVYNLVEELTSKFCFSFKEKYEKRWEDFYLSLKRRGKEISIPFKVIKYKRDYSCYFFRLGSLKISKGDKKIEKIYKKMFQEVLRFIHLIKMTQGEIVKKQFPMISVQEKSKVNTYLIKFFL